MTIRRRSQWSICIKLVVPTSSQSQWQPENARSRNQRRLMRVGRSWNCSFQSGVVNPGKVKIFVLCGSIRCTVGFSPSLP
eukprot:symbB.v1.2.020131.t1/scaffold1675.1/size114848/3